VVVGFEAQFTASEETVFQGEVYRPGETVSLVVPTDFEPYMEADGGPWRFEDDSPGFSSEALEELCRLYS
jgi:hypothetical protein